MLIREEISDENNIVYLGDDLIAGNNATEGDGIVVDSVNKSVVEYYYGLSGVAGLVYNGAKYYFRRNVQGDITRIYSIDGTLAACYTYDAWGNHKVYDANVNENVDPSFVGNVNPFRYRGYYYDSETGLYYCGSRYYDPEVGRWINADDISYLDPETINGLNLYSYCGNNPVMMVDDTGNKPKWWEWLFGSLAIVVGAVLCFVPGAQAFGVSLLVAGGTSMASSIMSAAGVDGKLASIISSSLSIVGGIALMFTPFAGIGASMIGAGIGGIAGGFISEALGGSFELGSMIGNIVGGIAGGNFYNYAKFSRIAKQGILVGKVEDGFASVAKSRGLASYKGIGSYPKIEKVLGKRLTARLGWANNYHYVKSVMNHGGVIYNLGGQLTGSYGKEMILLNGYRFLINLF